MLHEALNDVEIEGLVSEMKLEETSYLKDGKTIDVIRGEIEIRVDQEINGKLEPMVIPVRFFQSKYKKGTNEISKGYEGLRTAMKDYVSIASGGIERATRVRISNSPNFKHCRVSMNEYSRRDGSGITSFPVIGAMFINEVKNKEDFNPHASFHVNMFVAAIDQELDREGNETGRVKVTGVMPKYDGTVDVIPFYSANEKAAARIPEIWQPGDTVSAHGRLNFSAVTRSYTVESDEDDFSGDTVQVTRSSTVHVSEMLLTSGKVIDDGYDTDEIRAGLAARKARLDGMKANPVKPAPKKSVISEDDLDF